MNKSQDMLEMEMRRKALEHQIASRQEQLSGRTKKVRSELKRRFSFNETVKKNPLLTVGVALGLGFFIGRYLGNSSPRTSYRSELLFKDSPKSDLTESITSSIFSGLKSMASSRLKSTVLGLVSSFVFDKAQDYITDRLQSQFNKNINPEKESL
jgi:ElaB/YqjD/DUF883 family membrane-anchored ribosome-binding protein